MVNNCKGQMCFVKFHKEVEFVNIHRRSVCEISQRSQVCEISRRCQVHEISQNCGTDVNLMKFATISSNTKFLVSSNLNSTKFNKQYLFD